MPDGYRTYRVECGHTHVHVTQRKTDECGIACTGMILAMKKGLFVELSTLRSVSQSFPGISYRPSAEDAGAKTKDPRQAMLASIMMDRSANPKLDKNFGAGTVLSNLKNMLKKYGVETTSTSGTDKAPGAIMSAVATGKPVIAGVLWNGGGGHFIVVHGSDKGKYCILDPGADPGLVRSCVVGSKIYNAPYGGKGKFDECLVVS